MNIINSIRFSSLAENSFLSNVFSPTTGKKIEIVAVAAFALYLCFCTCRYFYYNWNMKDGEGKTVDFFGCVSEGEFKDGKLNGQGSKETLLDVDKGEFKNGKLNGQGSRTMNLAIIKREEIGEFKDNVLDGQGKETKYCKKYLFFGSFVLDVESEGEFKGGLLHGEGKRTWYGGFVEEGNFENGWLKA